mmetsp:Transcript_20364/g.47306  ORF Transcript_20364/g.47306 Transcript_20364/m.47306 type:complete len:217 (-) Transcript_20364:62-712(-)
MDALASATWALALDIASSVLALDCSLIVATSAFSRMFSPLTLSIWSSSASRSDMNSSFSASSAASSWRVCSATASDAFICSIVASIVCSSAPSPKLFSAPEGFMMFSRTFFSRPMTRFCRVSDSAVGVGGSGTCSFGVTASPPLGAPLDAGSTAARLPTVDWWQRLRGGVGAQACTLPPASSSARVRAPRAITDGCPGSRCDGTPALSCGAGAAAR